jgi:hypothetical protein
MSEIKVNKITPKQNCTQVTLGDSGDTFVIPSGVTITNNGTQTGFGRTGTVDWDTTAKTAGFTAVSGNGYFVNTTSGAITVTLPATPSAGDIVSIADYTNTWQTNNVTVGRNGSPIGGIPQDAILSTEGQSVTFIYVDGTEGWKSVQDSTSNVTGNPFISATGGTITTCGNCKIHTFTSPGTFCVSKIACCSANNEVSYMVVAGGGGGGSSWRSGGGGAGGFREDKSPVTPYTASPLDGAGPITVTATSFPITVGGGGTGGGPNFACSASNGSNSIFSTITSAGGGFGGTYTPGPGCGPATIGNPGGSGGGGGGDNEGPSAAGSGNTPPVAPPQGNNGGAGDPTGTNARGGGGGGATAVGRDGDSSPGGDGGAGATTSISGSSTAYAGGGGGGCYTTCCSPRPGGIGGGGPGGNAFGNPPQQYTGGTNGTANTGGGGGGKAGTSTCNTSGSGGSGIVIIRYKYQ